MIISMFIWPNFSEALRLFWFANVHEWKSLATSQVDRAVNRDSLLILLLPLHSFHCKATVWWCSPKKPCLVIIPNVLRCVTGIDSSTTLHLCLGNCGIDRPRFSMFLHLSNLVGFAKWWNPTLPCQLTVFRNAQGFFKSSTLHLKHWTWCWLALLDIQMTYPKV